MSPAAPLPDAAAAGLGRPGGPARRPGRHGLRRLSALLALLALPAALGAALGGAAGRAAPPLPAAAEAAGPALPAAAAAAEPLAPFTSSELKTLLRTGNLEDLALGCRRAEAEDRLDRLRLIRERLLTLLPAPQPLPVVLANADVLLGCRQPQAALVVLDRISPAAGAERLQWLLLQWRAAHAALDHPRAAFALARLTAARPERLDSLLLPVLRRDDGSIVSRPAMDLLAEHQRARGFEAAAATLLLASRDPAAAPERRLDAVRSLRRLPLEEREALLESALEQAAAAGAWGLVGELLDAQAALPSARAVERRLRLSPRIDDAYGEWLLRRQDPGATARAAELERQLRSPRSPGGHSAEPPAAAAPPSSPALPSAP